MILHMEADQVAPQHPIQYLFLIRTDGKDLRVRPGDMPEERDRDIRPLVLDHLAQQREMIILDKNKGIFGRQLLNNAVSKLLVYLFIHLPVGFPEDRAGESNMTKRPEAFVGKTVIEAAFLFGRQPNSF